MMRFVFAVTIAASLFNACAAVRQIGENALGDQQFRINQTLVLSNVPVRRGEVFFAGSRHSLQKAQVWIDGKPMMHGDGSQSQEVLPGFTVYDVWVDLPGQHTWRAVIYYKDVDGTFRVLRQTPNYTFYVDPNYRDARAHGRHHWRVEIY